MISTDMNAAQKAAKAALPKGRSECVVEASVRGAIEFRRVQTEFHARGQAAWEQYQHLGESKPAQAVIDGLQARLDAKRRQLLGQ